MKYKHLTIIILFIIWIINLYFVCITEYEEQQIPLEGVSLVILSFLLIILIANFLHENWDKPIRSTKL